MATLKFYHTPPLPCEYVTATSTFITCLGCLTAHEIRFCNGDTIPSWTLCTKHQVLKDQNGVQYNEDMLQFLRESVYDGSIPKPKPNMHALGLGSVGNVFDSRGSNHNHELSMSPRLMYECRDDRGHESERTPESCCNTSFGTSTPPSSDVQPWILRKEAIHILWPTPTSEYSHIPTCFHHQAPRFTTETITVDQHSSSDMPAIKLLTSSEALTQQDSLRTGIMAALRRESSERWEMGDINVNIDRRIRDMEEELVTSRLAKGVFFRRCNGTYVNALGWVYKDGKMDTEKAEGDQKTRIASATLDTNKASGDDSVDSPIPQNQNMDEHSRTTTGSKPNGSNVHKADKFDQTNFSNYESSHQDTSSLGTPTSTTVRKRRTARFTNHHTKTAEPQPQTPPQKPTFASPSPSPTILTPSSSTSNPSGSTAIDTSTALGSHDPPVFIHPDRYQAREQLVQSGAVSPEDLIITCWAWNQQARKQSDDQHCRRGASEHGTMSRG